MEEPKVIRRGTQTPEQSVFGHDYTVQPITKIFADQVGEGRNLFGFQRMGLDVF